MRWLSFDGISIMGCQECIFIEGKRVILFTRKNNGSFFIIFFILNYYYSGCVREKELDYQELELVCSG